MRTGGGLPLGAGAGQHDGHSTCTGGRITAGPGDVSDALPDDFSDSAADDAWVDIADGDVRNDDVPRACPTLGGPRRRRRDRIGGGLLRGVGAEQQMGNCTDETGGCDDSDSWEDVSRDEESTGDSHNDGVSHAAPALNGPRRRGTGGTGGGLPQGFVVGQQHGQDNDQSMHISQIHGGGLPQGVGAGQHVDNCTDETGGCDGDSHDDGVSHAAPALNGPRRRGSGGTGGGLPQGFVVRQQHGQDNDQTIHITQNHGGSTTNTPGRLGTAPTGHATADRAQQRATERARRSQARAGRWRSNGGLALQRLRSRLHNFQAGAKATRQRVRPSHEDLVQDSLREHIKASQKPSAPTTADAYEVLQEQRREEQAIQDLLATMDTDGYGGVPDNKPDGVIRLYGENVNNFGIYDDSRSWKLKRLRDLNKRYKTDAALFREGGLDYRQTPPDGGFDTFFRGEENTCVAASDVAEDSARTQPGGTAAVAFSRLSGFMLDSGQDTTGLGRWSWFKVGTGTTVTRIVTAYQPTTPSLRARTAKGRASSTVWAQHRRYFRKRGIFLSPRRMFQDQLTAQLTTWHDAGEEIILFTDMNDNVYDSLLASRLTSSSLQMREQFEQVEGFHAPASHFRGSRPITGCFATPGVDCLALYVSPHQKGAGDHRYWVMDFCARSVLGIEYPRLARPRGRKLKCYVERSMKKYLKRLRRLSLEHRVFDKMESLQDMVGSRSREDCELAFNKWDKEYTELQTASEDKCNKFMDGSIEYSPLVGEWIRRRDCYARIVHLRTTGSTASISNLRRTCARLDITDPLAMPLETAQAKYDACVKRLSELRAVAPQLRREHLRTCLSSARSRRDEAAVRRIREILKSEALRDRWKAVTRSTKPKRGAAVTRVMVKDDEGTHTYETKADVEEQAQGKMAKRFRIACDAPVCFGSLFDDVGYLGDTEATAKILRGEYHFKDDVDRYTKLLLIEAHKLFMSKSKEEIATMISGNDFSFYWLHAHEFTSSSASNIHFGHYKAAAHDKYFSALQAAKLSFAARTGIPLERWGAALTVLLEKQFGNIYLDKMRAICLLEADFNFMNKLVFAKRMMDSAYEHGQVPIEQFARRGRQAAHGVLCKVLFCDMIRALHVTAGVESVDLGNCYDAVAHPMASIALQAFKVPLLMTVLALSVLQTMTFFLRTGHGVAEKGYGGTKDKPMFGYGQGNGMAPPAFLTLSALMSNTYRRLGHGSAFVGSWSGVMFFLAAIIFVDDTDLLHIAKRRGMSDIDFSHQVQQATFDWGFIVQATGGYLKPAKCFWYMLSWHWVRGEPRLKKLRSLPWQPLMVPQKDGNPAPIPLKDVHHAEKTLGIWTCPAGDFGVHLNEIRKAGKQWTTRLRGRPLPARDAWLGFRYALYRKLNYGFSAVVADPDDLEHTFSVIYRDALSCLGVNKNIMLYYRLAPKRFMGLEMPHPTIDMLSQKLQLLRSEWDQLTPTGNMLRQSLEVFQMELGMSGNVFDLDYDLWSPLCSDGWWKNFWHLCSMFKVNFKLDGRFCIPLLREGDEPFMDWVVRSGPFTAAEIIKINRVRKFKGVHSVADFLLCDGRTVNRWVLTRDPSQSTRVFSEERPTPKDFRLFSDAIHARSSPQLTLDAPLGGFISRPHWPDRWFLNEDSSILCEVLSNREYIQRTLRDDGPSTRHGSRYGGVFRRRGQCDQSIRASVFPSATGMVVQSSAPVFMPTKDRRSFLERLRASVHPDLWRTFECDSDGEWIYLGLLRNSLAMVSDGSYNAELANDVSAGAFVIRCEETGFHASGAWVEKSDSHSADNYRAELLGALALQHVCQVAVEGQYISMDMRPMFGCDNDGVNSHARKPWRPMAERQPQADLLRAFKSIIRRSKFKARFFHVIAHLDDYLPWDMLRPAEQVNVLADKRAEEALALALETDSFIPRIFPGEDISVSVGPTKITGDARAAILLHWGEGQARQHFHDVKMIHRDDFDSVDWDSVQGTLKAAPEMWSVWATKQTSGFCATNHHLRHIDGTTVDKCPNCSCSPERADHISRCLDSGRSRLFESSVQDLREWFGRQRTAPLLAHMACAYLRARGGRSMTSYAVAGSPFAVLARRHDRLGWKNFLEGRIVTDWEELQARHYRRFGLQRSSKRWARGLVQRLLQITHRQWTYRNSTVHIKTHDNLTEAQHHALLQRCEDLLWTDPDQLLAGDADLLSVDFEALGSGPAVDRQLWAEEMESSIAAAGHSRRVSVTGAAREDPIVDTEGSIRYRRRRRRSLVVPSTGI